MQFYILMKDYGRKRADQDGPSGFEAVCQPEVTRRAIVEEVRSILSEGRNEVAFVKFIDGNFCEDVTAEIIAEARSLMLQAAE